jgi:hypothetical protein
MIDLILKAIKKGYENREEKEKIEEIEEVEETKLIKVLKKIREETCNGKIKWIDRCVIETTYTSESEEFFISSHCFHIGDIAIIPETELERIELLTLHKTIRIELEKSKKILLEEIFDTILLDK